MTIHEITPQSINTAAEVVWTLQSAGMTDPQTIIDNILVKAFVTGSWTPPNIKIDKWANPEAFSMPVHLNAVKERI